LKKTNTLLFVHDSLPAEGISGMVVFLRHFTALKNWDIHILIPENAFQKEVVDLYPAHFKVHSFPIRLFWWPSFREDIPMMVRIRIWALSSLFKNYIKKIKPDVLISVPYHYYSVAIAQNAKQSHVPLISFLHDRWDITSNNPYIQSVRKHYAQQTLIKSNHILSVTKALITHYLGAMPAKAEVLFPIPDSEVKQGKVQTSIKHLIYAGTVEDHHINFFTKILPLLQEMGWQLSVISNSIDKIANLAQLFKSLNLIKAFKTNSEALEYMRNNASVILVNYGINIQDNPFASHSFPSKFVEYCGLAKPILAVAPTDSPFHQFLIAQKWLAFEEHFTISGFKNLLEKFSNERFYQKSLYQTKQLRIGAFNPIKIQERFEEVLMNLTK
jgi:hypothetical protein